MVLILFVLLIHNKTTNTMTTLTVKQFLNQFNAEKFEVNASAQTWTQLDSVGGYVEIYRYSTRTRETIKVVPNALPTIPGADGSEDLKYILSRIAQ